MGMSGDRPRHFEIVAQTRRVRTDDEKLRVTSIDPVIAGILPERPRALTPKEISGLQKWFGVEGQFPAVLIAKLFSFAPSAMLQATESAEERKGVRIAM